MTITLAWWCVPVALAATAVLLVFVWPDEPSGFLAGGPSVPKILVIVALLVAAAAFTAGALIV